MYTPKDLKNKLIDHMMAFDLSKLTMQELSGYTEIISKINSIDKSDYLDAMIKVFQNNPGWNKGPDCVCCTPEEAKTYA